MVKERKKREREWVKGNREGGIVLRERETMWAVEKKARARRHCDTNSDNDAGEVEESDNFPFSSRR